MKLRIIRIAVIVLALGFLTYEVIPVLASDGTKPTVLAEETAVISETAGGEQNSAAETGTEPETEGQQQSETAEKESTNPSAVITKVPGNFSRPQANQMMFSQDDSVILKMSENDVRVLRTDDYVDEEGWIKDDLLWDFVTELSYDYGYMCTAAYPVINPATGGYALGQYIDEYATHESLVNALRQKGVSTAYAQWYYPSFAGGGGGTYIEINISYQHLWFFKNGSLLVDSPVVTGLNDAEHATPTGTFSVLNKNSNTRLKGSMGDDTWDEFVNFWLGVTGDGVGIHDAPWRDYFGGGIYQYGGSHGCINVPYSNMSVIFNNAGVGTTVVITY